MDNRILEIELINKQIENWQSKIDQLSKDVKENKTESNNNFSDEIMSEINNLQQMIDDEKLKIDELKNHDDAAWQTLKEGIQAAWELMKMNVEDAFNKITRK